MVHVQGPMKTPPPGLKRLESHGLQAAERSHIPAFEVMRITGEIAEARAAGRDVVSLCAGEPSARPAPNNITAAGYTSPLGTIELREAIAGHYDRWYGAKVDPARIAITTGSSGAFQLGFLAAFNPGDRVALASPGYPAYRNILTALGIEVVELPTTLESRYQPTPAMLDAAARDGGPLAGLIVASPANPTGSMLTRDELRALHSWCVRNSTLFVSDEIYHGITYPQAGATDPRGTSAMQFGDESLVINSFSKYWGMTGWRLGWAILPEYLVAPFEALASNFALSAPSPAQEFALDAFSEETYAEREAVVAGFARSRELILEAEASLGWGASSPADGAFYYYADLGPQLEWCGDSVTYAKRLLDEADVAIVPGVDFDPDAGNRTVRLSFAAGVPAVEEALARIIAFQEKVAR
ncbi:aminotransferase class I/II-fold pyridoxal phosphate-dependent enzyme [Leucobacter sp. UCMA 4100]|uniref:pyridoxal phosphate-dependent aminotransferase n=1 Tax=Leucobacter sp. UCMA 4100 TaxID=2810534 RepID=UPI0022EB24F8|nr:aminotransferase class I/II-fold pyridoxal phosphate-dependent enzyme [Leucobacter sp. UCMA 4100]MDA3147943.1 aminotransferase class I/II-fold pyridoxal phosphate-dependent enzyme [Leucobacter sp. UCMA 4100]